MTELLIIKTNNSKKLRSILDKEKVNYEIFFTQENNEKEDKLLQEYQEAWQNPQRLAEAKQWEQAAMNDWAERTKKDKK